MTSASVILAIDRAEDEINVDFQDDRRSRSCDSHVGFGSRTQPNSAERHTVQVRPAPDYRVSQYRRPSPKAHYVTLGFVCRHHHLAKG